MDKQTQELLEKLAEQLGTTVEYLWQVLLKQAQIDAFTTLFQIILIILFGIILIRLHKKFLKEMPEDSFDHNLYDKHGSYVIVPMLFGAVVFICLAVSAFFALSYMIDGFLNPEYWALQKILSTIGN